MGPWLITFALLGILPTDPALSDQVDLVEINHVYDKQGKRVLDQVIFYEWSHADARYQVIAWRLLRSSHQIPRRRWAAESYEARWFDTHVLRKVVTGQLRETWTSYDPEMVERAIYPMEDRRELATRDWF